MPWRVGSFSIRSFIVLIELSLIIEDFGLFLKISEFGFAISDCFGIRILEFGFRIFKSDTGNS